MQENNNRIPWQDITGKPIIPDLSDIDARVEAKLNELKGEYVRKADLKETIQQLVKEAIDSASKQLVVDFEKMLAKAQEQ